MKLLAATLTLLVSSAAAAQECQTCSMADACTKTYLKAASDAERATKQAIRDWKQNLDKKASAELSSKGTVALRDAMESQVRLELERLKECLAKIKWRPQLSTLHFPFRWHDLIRPCSPLIIARCCRGTLSVRSTPRSFVLIQINAYSLR